VQQVSLTWLVYRNTGSAALLGVAAFCALAPQLVVGPVAGALVDANEKKLWALIIQGLLAAQAFLLAGMANANALSTSAIITISLFIGVLTSFDMPLRQSLIVSYVHSHEDLSNAVALNTMLFNIGRLAGPPLAGLLLGVTSASTCFALNGASYLILFAVIFFLKEKRLPKAQGSVRNIFKEGLSYAWTQQSVRIQLVILIVFNLTASSYAVLLPIFARETFSGDARILGWLWGAVGGGALTGTVFLASLFSMTRLATAAVAGVALSSVSLLAFSMTQNIVIATIEMFMLGFGIAICNAGINIILQHNAPSHFRARIVSLFTAIRFGFDALGCLLSGFLAAYIGAAQTFMAQGAILLFFAAYLCARRSRLEPDSAARNSI